MKRFMAMWICSMLMVTSVFCQTVYPRKAVIDKDTVCIISIEQTKLINHVFIDRDECRELNDSLNSQIRNYASLVQSQKDVIASQRAEVDLQKKIVNEKNTIIESDDKLLKNSEKKIKWLKFQRTIFPIGAVAVVVAVKILFFKP